MSSITIKMEVTPAEYAQVLDLVAKEWDENATNIYRSRDTYLEYRSVSDKEAGVPERLGQYSIERAVKAVAKCEALKGLVALFGLDKAIEPGHLTVLAEVQAEKVEQDAADLAKAERDAQSLLDDQDEAA